MSVVLPAPVCPTTAMVSPGSMLKLTSRSTQSSSVVGEPDVIELEAAAAIGHRLRRGGARDLRLVSSSLKMRSADGHGGLQDVVLFAEVLNGAEEAQAVLEERHQHAEGERALLDAESAVGEQHGEGEHAEELDHRVEPAVGEDGVLERVHVLAVDGSNCSALLRSRLNSCRTTMPLTCSCRYALIRAMATRMRR